MRIYRYRLPNGDELLLQIFDDDAGPFGQEIEVALRPVGARTWGPPLEPEDVVVTP